MKNTKNKFWEWYGFTDNPFDSSPLSPIHNSHLAMENAFVKRSEAVEIPSENNWVLEGEAGIGRTTFVNNYRYHREFGSQKLFSSLREFSLSIHMSLNQISLNILGGLAHKYLLIFGEQELQRDPLFSTIWKHYQGAVLQNPSVSYSEILHWYYEATRRVGELGYTGIVLHIDDIELLARSEPDRIRHLLEEMRDLLEVPNIHYIFVSYPGFFREVIAPFDHLSNLFYDQPLYLSPLSPDEVITAIEKRYQILAGSRFIRPVSEHCILYLDNVCEGKIKLVLQSLQEVVQHISRQVPIEVNLDNLKSLLPVITEEKIRWLLTDREWKVFRNLAELNQKFTIPQICETMDLKKQNVSLYISNFLQHQLIYPVGKEGKAVVYKIRENLRFVAGAPELKTLKREVAAFDLSGLSERQSTIMTLYSGNNAWSATDISEATGIKIHNVRRELKVLVNMGYLERQGQTRNQIYLSRNDQ